MRSMDTHENVMTHDGEIALRAEPIQPLSKLRWRDRYAPIAPPRDE